MAFFLQIGLNELPNQRELLHALQVLALLPLQGVMFFVIHHRTIPSVKNVGHIQHHALTILVGQ